jgi:tight adherence protein B
MDGLVALAAAAGVLLMILLPRTMRERLEVVDAAGRLLETPDGAVPVERRALLAGLAGRFSKGRLGARLHRYQLNNHPASSFSDFLAVGSAGMIGGGLAGALLFQNPVLALVAVAAAPWGLDRIFIHLHGRRSAQMEKQLPEALALQAGVLRAGHSLARSLRVLGLETKAPLSDELRRTLDEIDLGTGVGVALERLATRSGSRDVELWVTAMLVHRQTGGSLASIAESLAGRVNQRLQLRSEVRALTAQGRLSGLVVAMAPVAFLLLLSVGSREQMRFLYSTPTGWVLLASGLAMNALGLVWIRLILRVRA